MTNTRRGPRWLGARAWLLYLVGLLMGCGPDEQDRALGSITLPVIVDDDGTLYRLKGSFAVREFATDTVVKRIATGTNADARVLSVPVFAGDYSVLLEPGWSLLRRDARGERPVAAALVSDNPVVMAVRAQQATRATFQLSVEGRVLSMAEGTVEIDIDVSEARCGNGVVELGEACDDGAQNGRERCDARCLFRCDGACPLRVDPTATKAGDGSSWDAPLTDLRAALQTEGRELWVRGGDVTNLPRGEPVTLAAGVTLRGGFAGTEHTADQRLPITPPTRLPGIVLQRAPSVWVERVVIGHPPPTITDEVTIGLEVSECDGLTLRDVEIRNARVDIRDARVRFEQVDIEPPYNDAVYVRASNFAWSGGSLGTAATYAGAVVQDSRVLLEQLDVSAFVWMDGERTEGLVLGCNFHDGGRTSGGGTQVLTMPRGVIVDSTFEDGVGAGRAAITGGSLFIWNSSFIDLSALHFRGGFPAASAITGDEVEIVLSSFYRNMCNPLTTTCNVDVTGVKRVTASLFVQEDPRPSLGEPAADASTYSVDTREGLAGNCFTYAMSAFTADPGYARPLLALHHPCPDAADPAALERARKRLVALVEPYRVPFFDADVARYSTPDWWRRQTVRAGRCSDDGAPDPGAHHPQPCPK